MKQKIKINVTKEVMSVLSAFLSMEDVAPGQIMLLVGLAASS